MTSIRRRTTIKRSTYTYLHQSSPCSFWRSTRRRAAAAWRSPTTIACSRCCQATQSRTHGERLPAEIAARAGSGRRVARAARSAGRGDRPRRVHRPAHRPGRDARAGDDVEQARDRRVGARRARRAESATRPTRRSIVPWMDAQRGEVFATLIDARSKRDARSRRSPRSPAAAARSLAVAPRRPAGASSSATPWRATQPLIDRARQRPLADSRVPSRSRRRSRVLGTTPGASRARPDRRTRSHPLYVRRPDAEIERDSGSRGRRDDRRCVVERIADRRATSTACSRSRPRRSTTRRRGSGTSASWSVRRSALSTCCGRPSVPVAAFCAFWRVADQTHINNLAIRPELRGRGLGTQLLEAIVAEAQRLGAASRRSRSGDRTSPPSGCTSAPAFTRRAFARTTTRSRSRMRSSSSSDQNLTTKYVTVRQVCYIPRHRGGDISHRPRKGGGNRWLRT